LVSVAKVTGGSDATIGGGYLEPRTRCSTALRRSNMDKRRWRAFWIVLCSLTTLSWCTATAATAAVETAKQGSRAPAEIDPSDANVARLGKLFRGPDRFDRAVMADVLGKGSPALVILTLDSASEKPLLLAKVRVYVRDEAGGRYGLVWESPEVVGFGVERFEARPLTRSHSDDVLLAMCEADSSLLVVYTSADTDGSAMHEVLEEHYSSFEVADRVGDLGAAITISNPIWPQYGENPPLALRAHVSMRTTFRYDSEQKRYAAVETVPDAKLECSLTLAELLYSPGATVYLDVTETELGPGRTECRFKPAGLLATKLPLGLRGYEAVRAVFGHSPEETTLEFLGPASE
jgi:hypothetical protein